MAKRYAIWDKVSPVVTPVGEYFTAAQWLERYPAAQVLTYVCQAGEINGGFFDSLAQMKAVYTQAGADFSACETDEACLEVIEAFEDEQRTAEPEASAEERIAAALEAQNLMAMDDATTSE